MRRESQSSRLAHRLVRTLSHAKRSYDGDEEDITFLLSMVRSNEFQALMDVHEVIAEWRGAENEAPAAKAEARTTHAADLLDDILASLDDVVARTSAARTGSAAKLLRLLSSPHFSSLVAAHDRVARRDFASAGVGDDTDGKLLANEEGLRQDGNGCLTVQLRKAMSQPLGATVKIKGDRVRIGRVLHGSVAHQSGMLHAGDEVLAINEMSVKGKKLEQVRKRKEKNCSCYIVKSNEWHFESAKAPSFMKLFVWRFVCLRMWVTVCAFAWTCVCVRIGE